MTNQQLSPCPDTPNCVSSMQVGTRHYIAPLRFSGSIGTAKTRLLEVINSFSLSWVSWKQKIATEDYHETLLSVRCVTERQHERGPRMICVLRKLNFRMKAARSSTSTVTEGLGILGNSSGRNRVEDCSTWLIAFSLM